MLLKHGLAGLAKAPDAGGLTKTFVSKTANPGQVINETTTFDASGMTAGDTIIVGVSKARGASGSVIADVLVESAGVTQFSATLEGLSDATSARCQSGFYSFAITAQMVTDGTVTLEYQGAGSAFLSTWRVEGTISTKTFSGTSYNSTTSPLSGNVATVSGGFVLTVASQEDTDGSIAESYTGVTQDTTNGVDAASEVHMTASAGTVSTETRTIEISHSGAGHGSIASLAVS